MKLSRWFTLVALGLMTVARLVAADAAALGFSPERLDRLDAAIQQQIDQHRLAGGVMFIARDGQVAHLKTFGHQDIESGKPMPADAIFRIASMSKAITTVAALILYEEGRFMLNDPVSKYIPAFAKPVVAVAPPADAPPGTKYVTVPAKRPITIRNLMTHTAGLTYGDTGSLAADDYKQANLQGWYFADNDETIGEAINRLAKLPLHGQPGEAWQYGFGIDVLGYLVEVVSGMPLDRFIEERITRPLKMPDTCFFLPPEKAGRLATLYTLGKEGLKRGDPDHYITGPRRCFAGGSGLLSTVHDYSRFLQMLLNDGQLDGVRILSPTTVTLMHTNQIGEKYATAGQRSPGTNAHGFGLGFWVNDDPGFMGEAIGKDAYGWGSAYFPEYVVDPKNRLVLFFMTQLRPAAGTNLNHRIKVLTYQALVK